MKKFVLLIFSLFIIVGFAYGNDTIIEKAKEEVRERLEQLPDNVKDIIPQGLDVNDLPAPVEEGMAMLKERCLRHGTNESFDRLMTARDEFWTCLGSQVNYTEVQEEIERAKPTGDLDLVFGKYCRKFPVLRTSLVNFTKALDSCLNPEERNFTQMITNITDTLVSFLCYKDGDRLALFVAEGGPQCLKSKQEEIQQCINATLSHYIPKDIPDPMGGLPTFKLRQAECTDVNALQKCVVTHLEKCSDPTPANMVDSIITYIKKATPCRQYEATAV